MSRVSRSLMLADLVLLASAFLLPIWVITLEAPQYPEGIGMRIRLHTIEGAKANDLENINGLNHYIGMKRIEPDSIAELRFMPYVVGGLILSGIIVVLLGRRMPLLVWIALFAATGAAGMADFYAWSYDYGHDLDPRAIIKIPGMSYQPPLIGSEQILNFTAHSWPGAGGIAIAAALLLAVAAWWHDRHPRIMPARSAGAALALVAACVLLPACSTGPRDIDFGKESCANCSMTITDRRFAAELVTATSKVHVFDAIECMADFVNERKVAEADIAALYVMRHDSPGNFTDGSKAWFLRSSGLRSPMGMHLAAFATEDALKATQSRMPGDLLRWTGVRLLVAKEFEY